MAITTITDQNFSAEVLNEKARPVLVDFWAPWCGPCKTQHPILEELAEEMPEIKFTSLNVDDNPTVAGRYQVMSIPTLIIFSDGQALGQLIGLQLKEVLRDKLATLAKVKTDE